MKKAVLTFWAMFSLVGVQAQGPSLTDGLPSHADSLFSSLEVDVNRMDEQGRLRLNDIASRYGNNRGVVLTMLSTGTTSVINVVASGFYDLFSIRSKQQRAWNEMRRRECTYLDSLQSIGGQCDFYEGTSAYGPLDPSDMSFDGITLTAGHRGKEVLFLVCRLDTSRFDELFTHSRFFLVLDSLAFYPYRSFLPNLSIDPRLMRPSDDVSQEDIDYWHTISRFDFDEMQSNSLHVKLDITSSWINELTQVFRDERLGEFSIDIPFDRNSLTDSVYTYSRRQALAEGARELINVSGGSFVVPRSFMPLEANRPSWGTGEYKMKITLSQNCQYNRKGKRALDWKRDYKQLVKLKNAGEVPNEYFAQMVTTFRDNGRSILKATFTSGLNAGVNALFSTSSSRSGGFGGSTSSGGSGAPGGSGTPGGSGGPGTH